MAKENNQCYSKEAYFPDYSITGYSETDMISSVSKNNISHGIPNINLNKNTWDGLPLKNYCDLNNTELCNWLFPDDNFILKGQIQLFKEIKPFEDINKPKIEEILLWNILIIRHLRNLLGIKIPVNFNRTLMLICRWSDERKYTTSWNNKYPNNICKKKGDSHCGAFWYPNNKEDQKPYLKDDNFITNKWINGVITEGIFGFDPKLTWFSIMSSIIKHTICNEGLTNHSGPFIHANKLGISFYYENDINKMRLIGTKFEKHPCISII